MSAVNEREISRIQDEDVLKKMWQDTEDFGKKKEIRAHMYKLREERLKDLYCNSDVKDVHLITNKKTSFNQSMHADALADHSFASLKRKEIRDSESPTKEVSYRIKGPSSNEGWNVSKIEEHSQDGKNHRYQQSAHTSGTEYIPKGKLDFEAKNNQEQTSYHDGDNNNFVKSQGTSSNSFIRQEAVGGDENSSFKSSSTKSSTSSRTVTEMKSSNGDSINYPTQPIEGVDRNNFKTSSTTNNSSSKTVTEQKSSNDDTVDYPRKQFIIESTGRNDNINNRTSSNMSSSSRSVTEQKSYGDSADYSRRPLQISDESIVDKTTKVYTTDAPRELKSHPGYVEGRTKVTRETKTLADGTVVTTTKYETSGANEAKSTSSNHYTTSSSTFQDNKSNVINSKSHDEKFSTHRVTEGRENIPSGKNQPKSRYYVEKTHTIPDSTESVYQNVNTRRESNVSEKKIDASKNYQSHVDQRYETRTTNDTVQNRGDTRNTENVRKQTVQHIEIDDGRRDNIDIQRKENVRKEVIDQNRVQQRTVATHDVNSVPLGTPIEIEINLTRINDNQERNVKPHSVSEPQTDRKAPKSTPNIYDTPQRREPVKRETELKTKNEATDGQYNTTYRTDYTNKKISVELSPTHDAFARSLRAVSPDRLNSRTNSRNLKNSNSSLRSSSSPEKSYLDRRHPQRGSPERHTNGRCYSPTKKTPEKFSSTETITYRTTSKPGTQRTSLDKNQKGRHTTELKLTTNHSTNTLTKKTNKSDDTTYKTPQSTPKSVPRSSIPNARDEITTDLDDNVSTYSHTTVTKNSRDIVQSDIDIKNIKEISIDDQKKTTNADNSTKGPLKRDQPIDRPLKRTDTYEERCRQILGITSDTTERRRSSLEKLRKRGSTVSSLTESIPKTSDKPDEITSKKSTEPTRQKSPTKQGTPIREFPSQTRKSPEKYSPENKVPREPSLTKERKPSVERKPIQEFPSQTRKSPEKQDSPTRNSPRGTEGTRPERKPSTERNQIQEFPSQIHKSPTKEDSPSRSSPKDTIYRRQERKPSSETKPIQEFPSQTRKSPEKQVSQTRSSPRDTIDNRNDKKPSTESRPTQEYPTNKAKSPEKQVSPTRSTPKGTRDNRQDRKPSTERRPSQDFPSQTRVAPKDQEHPRNIIEHQPFEGYSSPNPKSPEKHDRPSTKHRPIQEYPSQTRNSPSDQEQPRNIIQHQPTGEYSPDIHKSPEKHDRPSTEHKPIQEYPSQTRNAPQDQEQPRNIIEHQPFEGYSSPNPKSLEKHDRPSTKHRPIQEFPSQTHNAPSDQEQPRNIIQHQPTREYSPHIHKSPEKHDTPSTEHKPIQEFPSQTRNAPHDQEQPRNIIQHQPTGEYSSHIPKSPEKHDRPSTKHKPIQEYPSQTRNAPHDQEQPRNIIQHQPTGEYSPHIHKSPENHDRRSPEKISSRKTTESGVDDVSRNVVSQDQTVTKRFGTSSVFDDEIIINENRNIHQDKQERRTSTGHEIKNQVHFTDHEVRGFIQKEISAIEDDRRTTDQTVEFDVSRTKKNHPSQEKSPEKNIPDTQKSTKCQKNSEVEEFNSETTFYRRTSKDNLPNKQPTTEGRTPSTIKDTRKKPIYNRPAPSSDLPKEDTSSEEDNTEITEIRVTEEVVYDVPRNVMSNKPATSKVSKTTTLISNTDEKNLKNTVNVKTTIADYVSEDEQRTEDYLVKTDFETNRRENSKRVISTDGYPIEREPEEIDRNYPKSTPISMNKPSNKDNTPQRSPVSRKSPDKKTLHDATEGSNPKYPKQTQLKNRGPTQRKSIDSYEIDTVEQIEITDEQTTDEHTTRTKTVDELVKSFTSNDSKTLADIRKSTGKPTEKRPNTSSPYRKNNENIRQYEEVDTEDSTVITDEITFTSGTKKTTPTDKKPTIQPTQKNQSNISPSRKPNTPQIPDESVKLYSVDIEVKRKESTKDTESTIPFNRTPTDKDLRKPVKSTQPNSSSTSSPKKPITQKIVKDIRSYEEGDIDKLTVVRDQVELISVTKETDYNKPSNRPILKGPKDISRSKKPTDETDEIIRSVKDIDVEEYKKYVNSSVKNVSKHRNSQTESVTINQTTNDNLVCGKSPISSIPTNKKPSSEVNKPNNYEEINIDVVEIDSDEEINELKQTTLSQKTTKSVKRQDKDITEVHKNKYSSLDKDSRRPTNEPIEKTPNKSSPQKPTLSQKHPNERDTQKPPQRTPSGSSLPKRPTSSQRIDRNENFNVRVRNETLTIKKRNDQKQTETDFVKTKGVPTNRTNRIPTKSYPSEKPISRKPVGSNSKPAYEQPHSDYSSEAEEEIHTKKHILETYEGRTPVEEPMVMKKTISLLGSDDEDDKKTTQLLIESEITERQPITEQKKPNLVKSPKTTTTKLIKNEKQEVVSQKNKSPLKTPTSVNKTYKKPEIPKQPHTNDNKYNRRELNTNVNKQNTLKDIEKFDDVTEDKTIHLRTNRVDETVNRKKTTILKSNDSKPDTKFPKVTSTTTSNGLVPKMPSSRNTVEKNITKITTKTREPTKPLQKTAKPTPQQKTVVSSTVSSKTKMESKTSRTSTLKSKTETIKSKPVPKRITEPEESDEESLPDSLNGSVYSSLNDVRNSVQEREVQISTAETVKDFKPVHGTISSRLQPEARTKPELFNNEPREVSRPKAGSKSTKSIVMKTHDRGTVDLQRSMSSREATPDRACPLPVTSDDDGYAPRYPDKVVEPDEGYTRRRHERLFETSIHEDGDYRQSRKIVEINEDDNQSISGINRVDNDDDSLMTVDRKINKFLTTAGKLTEKSIVDISQPAPKVERPKFVVNDDLREDDCLLSVSDKVQKFITEAEHLTTQNDTQHRKSVNIEVKSDVSNKINQFTIPQPSKTNSSSPRKSSVARNLLPSDNDTKPDENKPRHPERQKPVSLTTLDKSKLDQDVFITTECAEIEKEEDLFRTSKLSSQPSTRPESQPEYTTTSEFKLRKNSSDATEKTSTQRKYSIENIEDDSDDTASKQRKNSIKEFTPKNRRPSQEDKVILSSVGRLRSNESIKKAKALFENTESITREEKRQQDILSRPSVFESRSKTVKEANLKKNIDRNNVTPKRLDFTSEKETEDIQQTKRRSIDRSSVETQSPMKTNRKPSTERDLPGYMKPLERNSKPGDQSPEPQDNRELLERDQPRRHYPDSIGRSREDKPKIFHEGPDSQVPGYMKPLEYTERNHSHIHKSQTNESEDLIRHDREHKQRNVHEGHESEVPGYMKPLEYTERNHSHINKSQIHESENLIEHNREYERRNVHEGPESEFPGYMKPLEYTERNHSHINKSQIHESETLIAHNREYERRNVHEGPESELPGYMKPLEYTELNHSHIQKSQTLESDEFLEHEREHKRRNFHEGPESDVPGYRQPLEYTQPEHTHTQKLQTLETQQHRHGHTDYHLDEDYQRCCKPTDSPSKHRIQNGDDTPSYMKPLDRFAKPQHPQRERSKSPENQRTSGRHPKHVGQREDLMHRNTPEPSEVYEGDLPGYMKPLDRSDRAHRSLSPKKDIPADNKPKEPAGTPTKFGVTLKRTDSSRGVITSATTTSEKKHPLLTKKNVTEEEIEEVYDLDVLEELLLRFTIYELRRKIRTQIRIVKKLISENKLEITIRNLRNRSKNTNQSIETTESTRVTKDYDDRNVRRTTPTRKVQETRQIDHRNLVEKQDNGISEYRRESVTSSTWSRTTESRRSESPEKASPERKYPERRQSNRKTPERTTPERSSLERRSSSKPTPQRNIVREENTTSYESTQRTTGKIRSEEPLKSTKTITPNVFKSSLKKTETKSKTPTSAPQPEWVTQRNLRKTGSNEVVKKTSVSSSSTVKKQNTRSSSVKESESTDLIASGYGIGPTDENGAPLFGLRALRAQNTNGTTKVQGTVISSQYYSENGKEPVGQISFTKYSSDPRDLGSNEDLSRNGDILSVTTTQKYGYEDAPSLKQLTSTKKEICDSQSSDKRRSSTKSSTITRRNSVKALTQKFVENTVEESKNERQSFYPKAGLILRSSSFKNDSAIDDDYDELLGEESREESVSVNSSHSKTVSGVTFLRNKSKVTGVQDAISRMKAEDVEYGDTPEDIEAKDLLNKYLGTQVILSGVEGHVSSTGTSSTRGTSLTTSNKSTSKITTVTTENGKEVTRTRTFEHPISDDVLETVWDEQTLRYLLDQSVNYEERKKLRARLRLIMAEQEACTELVKQASQDQSSQSIDETVETSKEVVSEGPVTTTKVTRVSTQQHISKKPMSPFAKFRQLDKQNSLNTPPSTPRTPGGSPLFKFTDAALSQSASTIKDRLLHWCRMKTKEYENIQLDNFSSSWADGLAFCALVHHFLPDAFDYHALTPKERRHNFTLAFKVADEKADIAPLLDVDDMVETMRPDWKCVFTYVQSIYRRFKDED